MGVLGSAETGGWLTPPDVLGEGPTPGDQALLSDEFRARLEYARNPLANDSRVIGPFCRPLQTMVNTDPRFSCMGLAQLYSPIAVRMGISYTALFAISRSRSSVGRATAF